MSCPKNACVEPKEPANSLIVWSPYLDRNQYVIDIRKFLKEDSHAIHDPLLERVEFQWNFDFL